MCLTFGCIAFVSSYEVKRGQANRNMEFSRWMCSFFFFSVSVGFVLCDHKLTRIETKTTTLIERRTKWKKKTYDFGIKSHVSCDCDFDSMSAHFWGITSPKTILISVQYESLFFSICVCVLPFCFISWAILFLFCLKKKKLIFFQFLCFSNEKLSHFLLIYVDHLWPWINTIKIMWERKKKWYPEPNHPIQARVRRRERKGGKTKCITKTHK